MGNDPGMLCWVPVRSGLPAGTIEMGLVHSRFTSTQPSTAWEDAWVCAHRRSYCTWEPYYITVLESITRGLPQLFSHPPVHFSINSVPFLGSSNFLSLLISPFHHTDILMCLCSKTTRCYSSALIPCHLRLRRPRAGCTPIGAHIIHCTSLSLHFYHILLVPNYVSHSSETLGFKPSFFIFVSPADSTVPGT